MGEQMGEQMVELAIDQLYNAIKDAVDIDTAHARFAGHLHGMLTVLEVRAKYCDDAEIAQSVRKMYKRMRVLAAVYARQQEQPVTHLTTRNNAKIIEEGGIK